MAESRMLYEGKAKRIWSTDAAGQVIMEFKDDATAHNGLKRGQITGKGAVNARVTAVLLTLLAAQGVATHFVRQMDDRRLEVRRLSMVPLEVVTRNIVAGSLAQRTGLPEGTDIPVPIVEIYYKSDALGDPLFNDEHVALVNAATPDELAQLKSQARRVNQLLSRFFAERDLLLVDFKLEFGRAGGQLVLGDEITPDTCRLWDRHTHEKLDKDRFRRDLGGVEDAYQEVLRRVVTP
jgi:phosphoribosylaminoimidazole-succinocarboxamide synthase